MGSKAAKEDIEANCLQFVATSSATILSALLWLVWLASPVLQIILNMYLAQDSGEFEQFFWA